MVLDDKRLGKQRAECKQIYLALTGQSKGWTTHPAVKMWKGYEQALCLYAFYICEEFKCRGYQDTQSPWFREKLPYDLDDVELPHWLGSNIHLTHKSNLLRKDYEWYKQFNWDVSDNLDYIWPKGK